MKNFSYVIRKPDPVNLIFNGDTEEVYEFHKSIEGYEPTPLAVLKNRADRMGIGKLWVKDESKRFGLNAFKGLGGSYAISKCLSEMEKSETSTNIVTFVTATDGNHGRGVAWAAAALGHKAVVYLPKGSAAERMENIKSLGAYAEITDVNYDDTVRYASQMAEKNGWILVQDTSWPGYEKIPTYIMQGYTTLAVEISKQLEGEIPTHVFLQAGVGSFAGAMAGYFSSLWKEKCPKIIIVEPDKADCLFKTAKADDGELRVVSGDMDSIMAGLCCGEPCSIGWEILKNSAECFISCSDEYAANGIRFLGRNEGDDPKVVSGESGAVTAGVIEALMMDEELAELKELLELNKSSKVLLISTEGDTDRENYIKIMDLDHDEF
ncbi:MAG: diaminopropionate ammonia-lyase [Clostridiales bacterium]|nr:diaminopropionate ammonia-lyase [Clostridiales bacterium]